MPRRRGQVPILSDGGNFFALSRFSRIAINACLRSHVCKPSRSLAGRRACGRRDPARNFRGEEARIRAGKPQDISRVTLQGVSGKAAVQLFDGPAGVKDDQLFILALAQIVSREHYPWLYASEPTLLVLRAILYKTAAEQDKLVQPVVIGTKAKQTLRDSGYLR